MNCSKCGAADCQCGQDSQAQKTCCQQNCCCSEQCCKDGCGPNCKCGSGKCATVRLQRTTGASIRPPQEHPAYK
ncbi:hypothetical protein Ddc_15346 [Ditylenchus destructor]|nr:hypothetical protein Ddc_15346 [Ditylenchus destructor]